MRGVPTTAVTGSYVALVVRFLSTSPRGQPGYEVGGVGPSPEQGDSSLGFPIADLIGRMSVNLTPLEGTTFEEITARIHAIAKCLSELCPLPPRQQAQRNIDLATIPCVVNDGINQQGRADSANSK